jgi:IclR family acetate operon transcriptional repressor
VTDIGERGGAGPRAAQAVPDGHVARRASGPDGARAAGRLVSILLVLAKHTQGLSLADLAHETGMTLSTTHRLVQAARASRLTRETASGLQALGPGVLVLARGFLGGLDFRVEALPVLSALRETYDEACHLGTLAPPFAVYVDKLDSTRPVRPASRIGGTVPALTTAVGRAILAYSDPGVVDQVLTSSRAQLGLELEDDDVTATLAGVRERGYSTDLEENEAGVCCVGAPIFDADGAVIAGISMSVPADRFATYDVAEVGTAVRGAADRISEALGHDI